MPALEAILRRSAALGVRELVIGMPHRGRLNVLANFVGKPYAAIFSEFQGNSTNPEHVHGSGDVKYHLGTSADREIGGTHHPSVIGRQPVASRSGRPGRPRQGPGQAAAARRRRAQPGRRHPDAWRRRLRRPGAGRRVARIVGADRLFHRRHDPPDRQQPDRLYHRTLGGAVEPLSVGRGQGRCRRRSFTSMATIPKRSSRWPASPPNTAANSTRMSSSTCSATGGMGTTKATSRRSPSP